MVWYEILWISAVLVALVVGFAFGYTSIPEKIVVEEVPVATPCRLDCNCVPCVCDCVAELEAKWREADAEREYLLGERSGNDRFYEGYLGVKE